MKVTTNESNVLLREIQWIFVYYGSSYPMKTFIWVRDSEARYSRITRRVSLVEQELHILPEHLMSPPVFSGVRVTWSLLLCVCYVGRCLSFCPFSFDHCVVCSSIYIFWLPLLYLQTLLTHFNKFISANAQQSFLGWNMQNKVVRKSIFYTLP